MAISIALGAFIRTQRTPPTIAPPPTNILKLADVSLTLGGVALTLD